MQLIINVLKPELRLDGSQLTVSLEANSGKDRKVNIFWNMEGSSTS